MKSGNTTILVVLMAIAALAPSAASAQTTTFQTYRCGDGTEFIVGFFQYDKRAHMQVDGKAVTLQVRMRECLDLMGAAAFPAGSEELNDLEFFLSYLSNGQPLAANPYRNW